MHAEVTIDREALMRIIDELDLDQMSNSPYKKQMGGSAENLSKGSSRFSHGQHQYGDSESRSFRGAQIGDVDLQNR